VLAALHDGAFARQGLRVEVRYESSGRAALEGVLAGRADLATVSEVPVMFAAASGAPLAIAATLSAGARDHGIVSRVSGPAELRGKRLGVPLRTSVHFFVEALLNRHGLSTRDLELVDLTPERALPALLRGEIDGMAGWQPHLQTALDALAGEGRLFGDPGVYDVMYNLAGLRDFLQREPDTIARVLRASIEGARACEARPAWLAAELARITGVAAPQLGERWHDYRFRVALDQGLLLALEDEARWAMKHALTDARSLPNHLHNIVFEPLQAVNPALVTLIH
jgi:NitT/TauT family transport system substrate-binding protein